MNNLLKILSGILVVFVFALVLEISSLGRISYEIQDLQKSFAEYKMQNDIIASNYSQYILDYEEFSSVEDSFDLIPVQNLVYLDTYHIDMSLSAVQ